MMIAILSPTLGGGATTTWPPPSSDAAIDFVNDRYFAGGSVRAISDILGGGFDAGELSGSGLYFDNDNDNRPVATGALASDLAAGLADGCTIVFEIDHISAPYGYFMCFLISSGLAGSTGYVALGHSDMLEDQTDIWFTGEFDYSATGIHKVAFTLNRALGGGSYAYDVSVDGGAAVTQTAAYPAFSPINTITIGHDGDDTFVLDDAYIRSITLYPAKLPADLPALTA